MIEHIKCQNLIGTDSHNYLIAMFEAIQRGWQPPKAVSEQEYRAVRTNKKGYPPELVGFIGFGCTYSGKWFGGYARGNASNGQPRNYCGESRRNILAQFVGIVLVDFYCCDYTETIGHKNAVMYCDPPYAGTTKYGQGDFNHAKFWEWCRQMAVDNTVLVSEYTAPDGIECIWQKTINSSLTKQTGSKQGTEKLFWVRPA